MDESSLLPNLAGDRVRAENARVNHAVAELLADLVTAVGIAEKAGVAINTVSVWQRRHATFPKPVTAPGVLYPMVEGRRVTLKLWRWSEVEEWIASRRRPAVAS
jgi:hypothetical protein